MDSSDNHVSIEISEIQQSNIDSPGRTPITSSDRKAMLCQYTSNVDRINEVHSEGSELLFLDLMLGRHLYTQP